ncbi:MAG: ribonuclease HII [Microgenomates group bacterium]
MSSPTFHFEKKLWRKGYLVVGVDEVGRGALAGPLVVGVVCFNPAENGGNHSLPGIESLGINDSKKLSPKKREVLAEIIKREALAFHLTKVSVGFINKYGIAKSFRKGLIEALKEMKRKLPFLTRSSQNSNRLFILIDGFYVKYLRGIGLKNQKAIVKGDEKSISIAAASIIAKVFRDRLMVQLSKKYPKYHWEKNKGYGTKEHIKALKTFGKTKLHRDLFLRKIVGKT